MNVGDLTRLDTVKEWLSLTGIAIADISLANPCVITLAQRPQTPMLSGVVYNLTGITGTVQLEGTSWRITVLSPTTFSIPVDSTLFGAFNGQGFVGIADPLVQRLISAASIYMQSWMNITVASQAYFEARSGQGATTMMLANHPVTGVSVVTVNGQAIPARPPLQSSSQFITQNFGNVPFGFVFDQYRVMLSGGCFTRGFQNISFAYRAGYLVANEAQTIPASAPYTLQGLAHWAASDAGVTYANGTPLVPVLAPSGAGSYSFADTVYTFDPADAGMPVLLSYGFVPADLEQAAVDMIGDWFRYRDRIGKVSEAIEAQSITFTNTSVPARAQGVMNQYRKVAPTL